MTVRWITTPKERMGKKYKALHRQLSAEVADNKQPDPSKADRRRARAADYRQNGGQ